jgi:hypothetical protein
LREPTSWARGREHHGHGFLHGRNHGSGEECIYCESEKETRPHDYTMASAACLGRVLRKECQHESKRERKQKKGLTQTNRRWNTADAPPRWRASSIRRKRYRAIVLALTTGRDSTDQIGLVSRATTLLLIVGSREGCLHVEAAPCLPNAEANNVVTPSTSPTSRAKASMAGTKSKRRSSKPTPPQPVWSFDRDAGLRKEMRLAQVRVSAPGVHTRGSTSPTL